MQLILIILLIITIILLGFLLRKPSKVSITGEIKNILSETLQKKIANTLDEWVDGVPPASSIQKITAEVVAKLNSIEGITQAHSRDFLKARPLFKLKDGSVIKAWKNPVGVQHIFIANNNGEMIFGGFVGWIHEKDLDKALQQIRRDFSE